MKVLHETVVALRRWQQVRGAGGPSPIAALERERGGLRAAFGGLRSQAASGALTDARLFEIPASQPPWFDSGIDVDEGQWVTTLAAGGIVLSDALDLRVGPAFQLWMRVGEEGRIFNGTRDTFSFQAPAGGRLYFGGCLPGQWGDPSGRVATSLHEYDEAVGGMTVAVLLWNGDAREGLASLASVGVAEAFVGAERARLDQAEATRPPDGWQPLWFLGDSEIFRPAIDEGRAVIACCTERNVGILQRNVALELRPGTRLRWSWKFDELPSRLPEDTRLSHDYLSIAVEFENGRDITYTWSCELPVGLGYWCPLPTWNDREFHVVQRSGAPLLGRWLDEERDLHADYRRYMGRPPARITRVWLIAASVFQRRRGVAAFRDIVLVDASGRETPVTSRDESLSTPAESGESAGT